MGNAQVPLKDEPRVLLAEFPDLVNADVLGSYKLFKVMQCSHEREGRVVVKLFIRRDGEPPLANVQQKIQQAKEAFAVPWLHPNVVPYQSMETSHRSAILLRQHFARNLFDRMHTRPFFSEMTKQWVAFQVLCSVCQAHSVGIAHGDLKSENIFVSSWSHVVLTDFAHFKPLFLPDDDPSEFSFYFESDLNRRRCYLAPERFDASAHTGSVMSERFSQELIAMDIFSTGCVLAELFLDGQTLMDLPELLRYRSNQLDLRAKLSGIKNPAVRELVGSMLHREPSKRGNAIEYLRRWCALAPASFCNCLFPLTVLLLHPLYQQPDMRVLLVRHNFASILWSTVGAARMSKALAVPLDGSWEAWRAHVDRCVRSVDEATLHSIMPVAVQGAHAGADTSMSHMGGESLYDGRTGDDGDLCETDDLGSRDATCRITHPWLREPCCQAFTTSLFEHWEAGCAASMASVDPDQSDGQSGIFESLLTGLCTPSTDCPDAGAPPVTGEVAVGSHEDDDVLSVLCSIICSSLQHVSNPRMKLVCLDMLESLAPFTSQSTVLEQIVPFCHMLMIDPFAKVRARAIAVLAKTLGRIEELPASDAPLFTEYLFPQLMSAMSGMSTTSEPVVLLSIAKNIGTLAQHAVRFAELSVAAQRGGRGEQARPVEADVPKAVEVEAFDVQVKHLREAVEKVVNKILETSAGVHDEVAVGREVKLALFGDTPTLSDIFGRDGTHNFLLLWLTSLCNDESWEARATFCSAAACLPRKVGQVSTEGMIWPAYEILLFDQEERVLEAALEGLAVLVSQQVLTRQLLVTVASRVAPLLVHPSSVLQQCAADVFNRLNTQLSAVDQFVFIMPILRPFLRFEVLGLQSIGEKLVRAVGRPVFKRAMLGRDEDLCEALLDGKRPLKTSDAEAAQDLAAFELLRPYAQVLLQRRPSTKSRPSHGKTRDEDGVFTEPSLRVQSSQYPTVNPYSVANRSPQALAELSDEAWPFVAQYDTGNVLDHFSMQTYLIRALCLLPRPRDLGSLNCLDGTPYSIYAAGSRLELESRTRDSRPHEHVDLDESLASSDIMPGVSGLPGVAAAGGAGRVRRREAIDEFEDDNRPTGHHSWRPKGILLATLYEYAHQSGVPVVKVDTTDDSRILVTGGKDGVVKLWNCRDLLNDVAVSSSHTLTVSSDKQRLRTLRTVHNSKAVAVGSESGDVFLYKMELSGTTASEACHLRSPERRGPCAVMCIEQFDTELENLLVFAQQNGRVQGWDVRSRSSSWSLPAVPRLGVPSCLALGSEGHAVVVGTMGGGVIVHDLRFLAPWKQWRVSSGASVMALRTAMTSSRNANLRDSPGVFAALSSDSNEVAYFDVVRGSCLTLFLTEPERQKDAVSVPSLRDVTPPMGGLASAGQVEATPELMLASFTSRRSTACVRSLWLPPRGAQTFLLAGGTDRKVRMWSLDPEHHSTEPYIVTPPDAERPRVSYTSNHLGDVFVVQEQSTRDTRVSVSTSQGGLEDRRSTNPNHRDAILDMCSISLQDHILVTAGRDGLVKLWR
uniref:non-specific serine/threonine protein kinase n=1 Tax=Noctiluca scintillans TaxID=2966 RepID=A0A7S1FIY7_NOCSC|mmetsp:Transcript_65253/g.172982  ORF Transcript_65253/g.172982 Transcript_65253/m.172982 type:complete len:1531 (+) Transcript_65253:35-4627(+)